MRNLVMFHGSCGHTMIDEVDDDTWERLATKPGHGPLGQEMALNRSRTGKTRRMVYVSPLRYCVCRVCIDQMFEEDQWDRQLAEDWDDRARQREIDDY